MDTSIWTSSQYLCVTSNCGGTLRKVGRGRVVQYTRTDTTRIMASSTRPARLVQVVKQWFTGRTVGESHIIRESYSIHTSPRPVQLGGLVQVVKKWFTSRTVGKSHIIRESYSIYTSPRPVQLGLLVRVVKKWFTSRTVGESHIIGRHIIGRLRVYIQVHDPYNSLDSYGSWNNGLRVVQLVNRISLERVTVYIQVHDLYNSVYSCGSWDNGLRVVQFVNRISLEGLRVVLGSSDVLILALTLWERRMFIVFCPLGHLGLEGGTCILISSYTVCSVVGLSRFENEECS